MNEPGLSPSSSRRSTTAPALAGAAIGAMVVAVVAWFLWPSAPAGTGADAAGGPGGGMGFGPMPVEVVEALETVAAEPVQLVGSATAVRESVVASEIEGLVDAVAVDEGDQVEAGDLVARLRTTTRELDLAAALANRAEAQAELVKFETELRRLTELRSKRAISEREYDQAVADRDAQAQTVARHDAEADRLRELITQTRITAPFGGQISAVQIEVGEWVGQGGAVATLVDLSEVEVTVPLPARYLSEAEAARRQGLPIEVRFDALSQTFEGRVKAVIPAANPQARTFPVLVSIANPEGRIKAGMLARVLAQVGEPGPVVLVPKDALVNRGERTFLYRVRAAAAPGGADGPPDQPAPAGDQRGGGGAPPATVEELEVRTGQAFGAWRVVIGNVSAGDLVIVRGNERVQPGAPVMVAGRAEIEPPPAPVEGRATGRPGRRP